MKLNILGTEYEVIKKKYNEDEVFERRSIAGYCDGYAKKIVVCDMKTYKGWEHEEAATIEQCEKLNMRHEIVHAFFNESGLQDSSLQFEGGWARNEELIDWIAIQAPKIYKVYEEVGCL